MHPVARLDRSSGCFVPLPAMLSRGACGTKLGGAPMHLYLHVPYCVRPCPYCGFYKETVGDADVGVSGYVDAVLTELAMRSEEGVAGVAAPAPRNTDGRWAPSTIFVGGGTPTALPGDELQRLLEGLAARLDLGRLDEWTLEANPATVSAAHAARWRVLGVNRVSLGVQSWDDHVLRRLGRMHNSHQAAESLRIVRGAGFDNVNLDLLFGVPGQDARSWDATLDRAIAAVPEHLSAYCLTYEEGTAFASRLAAGDLCRDEEMEATLFEHAMERIEAAGYRQYEISNYARPGFECRHNLGYWRGHDYLGLGPGAVSTVGLARWRNAPDARVYVERLRAGRWPRAIGEPLNARMRRGEILAFALRMDEGIDEDALAEAREQFEELERQGFVLRRDGRITLTRRGRLVADEIGSLVI